MNVETGAEAAQFPEKEYINEIAFAVQTIDDPICIFLLTFPYLCCLPGSCLRWRTWWCLKACKDGMNKPINYYFTKKLACHIHGVGRVLSFFSSRRNWDSPNPSPAGECSPLPLVPGVEAHYPLAREGVGEAQFWRWDTHCGTPYMCVLCCRNYSAIAYT